MCPTLCNPRDYSLPGSSVHGILEWVAVSFSGDLLNPGIEPGSPALQVDSIPSEPPGKHMGNGWHLPKALIEESIDKAWMGFREPVGVQHGGPRGRVTAGQLLLGLGGRNEVVRILAWVVPGRGTKATAKTNLEERKQILSLLHPGPPLQGLSPPGSLEPGRKG